MRVTVAWPMYAVDPRAVEVFWQGLRSHMIAAGVESVPDSLEWPQEFYEHWLSPTLLLSQTCGYPLTTGLAGRVNYLCTPRFRAAGCEGASYSSAVVIREDDPALSIVDCAGRRVAFNSSDSQSGYNALRALVAPHAKNGRFFSDSIETGAHRLSLRAIKAGQADVAAIDAITFALLSKGKPEEVEGLRILGYTDKAPGLPLITSLRTPPSDVARLRRALDEACADPELAQCCAALLLEGFELLPPAAYDAIGAMRNRAIGLAYPELA